LWNTFGNTIGNVLGGYWLQQGPDTYHTTKGISAAIASSIPAAARGGLQRLI